MIFIPESIRDINTGVTLHINSDGSINVISAGVNEYSYTGSSTAGSLSHTTSSTLRAVLQELVITSPSPNVTFLVSVKGETTSETKFITTRTVSTDASNVYSVSINKTVYNEKLIVSLTSLSEDGEYTIKLRYT